MMSAKTDEAKEFYLNLCIKNNYSKRELERQLNTMLFERNMLSDKRSKKLIAKNKNLGVLRDNYTLEFLNLPENSKCPLLGSCSIIASSSVFFLVDNAGR